MLEEIPTIEHMKKRRLDLYQHWLCPMCQQQKETFNHVWLCPDHKDILLDIIEYNIHQLIVLIKDNVELRNYPVFQDFDDQFLWSLEYLDNQFTFIDIIKGIIPLFFFNKINNFVNNNDITSSICSIFVHRVYKNIMEKIWKPRCEIVNRRESHLGITSKIKKQRKPSSCANISYPPHVYLDNLFLEKEGLRNKIYFGGDILGFTILVSQFTGH